MLILLTSTGALLSAGTVRRDVAQVLIQASGRGIPVGVVSNHGQPQWFTDVFGKSNVKFLRTTGRQDGRIISANAERLNVLPYDCLVLAANDADVQMGKNGDAVLIGAGWSENSKVKDLSIRATDANELSQVLGLLTAWQGAWWFSGDGPGYSVRALADLSQIHKSITQQEFSETLKKVVKRGGPKLNVLLALSSRSLMVDGISNLDKLLFCVYPSSGSSNDDSEVLSDFTHRMRTAISLARYTQRGCPLFIRHRPSLKRSLTGGNREDPTDQIGSLHLNRFYEKTIKNRNIVVVDDCTTYGLSFGVSAALLRAAGAASVIGVALGKFGNTLKNFEINITGNPFSPLKARDWRLTSVTPFNGTSNNSSQQAITKIFS